MTTPVRRKPLYERSFPLVTPTNHSDVLFYVCAAEQRLLEHLFYLLYKQIAVICLFARDRTSSAVTMIKTFIPIGHTKRPITVASWFSSFLSMAVYKPYKMQYVQLSNGYSIPCVGFGTSQVSRSRQLVYRLFARLMIRVWRLLCTAPWTADTGISTVPPFMETKRQLVLLSLKDALGKMPWREKICSSPRRFVNISAKD